MSKKISMLALAGAFVVGVAACGGGGGSSNPSTSEVGGTAVKGAFTTCSAVATKVDATQANGLSTTDIADFSCTNGTYSGSASWSGPTIIEVYGTYYDEELGENYDEELGENVDLAEGSGLKTTVDLVLNATASASPNIYSHMAAEQFLTAVGSSSKSEAELQAAMETADDAVENSAGITLPAGMSFADYKLSGEITGVAVAIFSGQQGLMKTVRDSYVSAGSTPTGANVFDTMVSVGTAAVVNGATLNQQLVTHAGTNADFTYTSGQLADDVVARVEEPVAITSGGTAPTISTDDQNTYKATAYDSNAVKGISCVSGNGDGNRVDIDGTYYQFNASGVVNPDANDNAQSVSVSSANPLTFACNVRAYNNTTVLGSDGTPATGTEAGTQAAAQTWTEVPFSFYINGTSTGDGRMVKATLDKATVTLGATSGTDTIPSSVSVTIPANAKLAYSGTNTSGTAVVGGTVTNSAVDTTGTSLSSVISASGNVLTINATALLTKINSKVGDSHELNISGTTGNFTYAIGFGVPIGYISGSKLSGSIPRDSSTSNKVTGPQISGKLTIN